MVEELGADGEAEGDEGEQVDPVAVGGGEGGSEEGGQEEQDERHWVNALL